MVPRTLAVGALLCSAAAACFTGNPAGQENGSGDNSGSGPPLSTALTMHRLTRIEYSNTVHDLLGEPVAVGDSFPADEVNELGYDNDGATLNTSSLLVDQYQTAAEGLVVSLFARLKPLSLAFTKIVPKPCTNIQEGIDACGTTNGGLDSATGFWGMISALGGVTMSGVTVPANGTYSFTLQAYATPVISTKSGGKTKAGQPYPVIMGVVIDGLSKSFDVTAVPKSAPQTFTFTTPLTRGKHFIEVKSISDSLDPDNQDQNWYNKTLWVSKMKLDGPNASGTVTPDVLGCGGAAPNSDECMRAVLENFATRAWRRPVTPAEIDGLKAVADTISTSASEPGTPEEKFQSAAMLGIESALMSPNFLYRPELDPDPNATDAHPVTDYELASRLSYFLWSTMPDDELTGHAKDGSLHDPAVLDAQVERMLADPKGDALADNFGGQWLYTRRMKTASPDTTVFTTFTPEVRDAMAKETQLFFKEYLKPGRRMLDMLDADFTFANPTLAAYYGLSAPGGTDFAQTPLAGSKRMGVLSQGSILTLTSHANRTSPVLRGKFVLRQLLCDAPPAPPPNVPPFNEDETAGSVRQRMEAHAKGICASCHAQMDPIGFSLENFDATGLWRDKDGTFPVDTTGLELGDTPIAGIDTLAAVVKNDSRLPLCVVKQLLSYALGQEVQEQKDGPVLDKLVSDGAANGYEFRSLIHAIVNSKAFTTRGGDK